MDKKLLYFILIIMLSLLCKKNEIPEGPYSHYSVPFPSIPDMVNLEWTLGEDSNLQYDFILVKPKYLTVTDNHEFVIFDEFSIKVYDDSSAKSIKRIGQKGLGPGDFYDIMCKMLLSPKGYITITDNINNSIYYTLYDSNFKFIDKLHIKTSNNFWG